MTETETLEEMLARVPEKWGIEMDRRADGTWHVWIAPYINSDGLYGHGATLSEALRAAIAKLGEMND